MGWLFVLGLEEGLVECATLCIKSWVILLYIYLQSGKCVPAHWSSTFVCNKRRSLHLLPGRILHLFSSHLQAMIIVGMCLDSSKSYTTRFFKTRLMQFLGQISMALYLSHTIVINVIKLFIYGPVALKTGEHSPIPKMPPWAIPIHLAISLILSILLTFYIEEPTRKFFSKKLANTSQIISEGNCGVLNFPKKQHSSKKLKSVLVRKPENTAFCPF